MERLTVPEDEVEVWVRLDRLSLLEHAGDEQLLVENVLGERRLDDVGPVERVHAVGPHDRLLHLDSVGRASRHLEESEWRRSETDGKSARVPPRFGAQ